MQVFINVGKSTNKGREFDYFHIARRLVCLSVFFFFLCLVYQHEHIGHGEAADQITNRIYPEEKNMFLKVLISIFLNQAHHFSGADDRSC